MVPPAGVYPYPILVLSKNAMPQELLSLKATDLETNLTDELLVIRLERTKTSKQHLQSLTLRHRRITASVALMLNSCSSVWLWPWSSTYFRRCFTSLCNFLHLSSYNFVPYSLRQGGATHFYIHLQSLDFVMVQGRWKDQRTCRLYVDDARAMLVNFTLPEASISLLKRFRYHFLNG